MIDFYTWKTPNGQKVAIMLEETHLAFKIHPIDLTKQEQFSVHYLKINPNNKIPAIVDHEGPGNKPLTVVESGAILIYLAEKTGQFLATDPVERSLTIQWLMFQMGGVGPMLGQLHHFLHYAAEKVLYGIERYSNEAHRLYRVMDNQLEKNLYFAGDYSIADMAIFPWVNLYERQRIDLDDYPNVQRWHKALLLRPAIIKALQLV